MLLSGADIDESIVKLVASGMGSSIERKAPPAPENPSKQSVARKAHKRGAKACGCGRPISANATQCAKCAGLVDKVAGFVG